MQTAVFALLPLNRPSYTDNPYISFLAGLAAVFTCYLVRILYLLWQQSKSSFLLDFRINLLLGFAATVDVFFVDWEKPRGTLLRLGAEHESALGKNVATGIPGLVAPPSK
jgi:hypothetical protein